MLANERIDQVFYAAIEATEEAIVNALLAAETTTGREAARPRTGSTTRCSRTCSTAIASGRERPSGSPVRSARRGLQLGRAAWPTEVVDGVKAEVVLDLAAGTGKLTRLLVERVPRVIAVEPLARMRAVLERVVPEAESLEGTAEAIPLPDASVDAAFVAEAFHWFDAPAAARELARVIRPGGMLRLVFNVWKGPFRPSLGPEARRLLEQVGPGGGAKVRAGEWKRGFDELPFTPLVERHVDHEDVADRERVVAHLVSTSSAGELAESDRQALADAPPKVDRRRRVPCRDRHACLRGAAPVKEVKLSSADRVLFPDDGVTKGDVFEYYDAVADTIVPHLKDRPFTLRRYPNGITQQAYFQKQAPKGIPDWIPTRQFVTSPARGRLAAGRLRARQLARGAALDGADELRRHERVVLARRQARAARLRRLRPRPARRRRSPTRSGSPTSCESTGGARPAPT